MSFIEEQVHTEDSVERLSGAELASNLEFLRAAGIDSLTLEPVQNNTEDAIRESSGLAIALRALATDLTNKMGEFSRRLTALETRPPTPEVKSDQPIVTSTPAPEARSENVPTVTPPSEREQPSRLWADRQVDEVPDYSTPVTWDDEEEDTTMVGQKLFAVSEGTEKLLRESFTKAMPNSARRQLRERNGDPKCPPTRIPKLDKMVRDRMSQGSVKLDRSLARLKALSVYATGPLASLIEQGNRGELTTEKAVAMAKTAIRFLGNASLQFNRERRKRAIEEMNGKLVELADKDEIFADAAPALFGDRFAKEAKEREDQLRCLDRASHRGGYSRPQHFQNRRPHAFRRGGGVNAARSGPPYGTAGRGRFQPYYKPNMYDMRGKENFHPKGRGKTA